VGHTLTAIASAAIVLLAAGGARGDGLSQSETERLWHGETVVRAQAVSQGDERYVGGVTYTVVDTSADDLTAMLGNVDTWRRILPKIRAARPVGSTEGDLLVELTHGTSILQATYTIRVHRNGHEVRFWMDRRRNHDIQDAWGFLRATPIASGRSLVTYGVLIDMGPGLLRDLFEGRVRDLALSVPDRVRGLVLERNAAGQRAAQ